MSFHLEKKSAFPSVNPSKLPSQMLERFHRLDSESGAAISRSEYLQLQALARHYQGNERFASLSMPQIFKELDALKTISKLTPPPPSFGERLENSAMAMGAAISPWNVIWGVAWAAVTAWYVYVLGDICWAMSVVSAAKRCNEGEEIFKNLPSRIEELTPEQYKKEACRAEYNLSRCSAEQRVRSGLNASPAADEESFLTRCLPYISEFFNEEYPPRNP